MANRIADNLWQLEIPLVGNPLKNLIRRMRLTLCRLAMTISGSATTRMGPPRTGCRSQETCAFPM